MWQGVATQVAIGRLFCPGVLGRHHGVYTYSEGVCSGACATEDVKKNLSPNLSFEQATIFTVCVNF